MANRQDEPTSDPLDELLAEFDERQRRESLRPEDFIAEHPEPAERLRRYFADAGMVEARLAPPDRGARPSAEPDSAREPARVTLDQFVGNLVRSGLMTAAEIQATVVYQGETKGLEHETLRGLGKQMVGVAKRWPRLVSAIGGGGLSLAVLIVLLLAKPYGPPPPLAVAPFDAAQAKKHQAPRAAVFEEPKHEPPHKNIFRAACLIREQRTRQRERAVCFALPERLWESAGLC